jgi:hypothetical protein
MAEKIITPVYFVIELVAVKDAPPQHHGIKVKKPGLAKRMVCMESLYIIYG